MMTEYIQMKNILVTKIEREEHKTIVEVCFENIGEPEYCRLYKATLTKDVEWSIQSIAAYDIHKEKFLSVGSLYAPVLYEEIKFKILRSLNQDTIVERRAAL